MRDPLSHDSVPMPLGPPIRREPEPAPVRPRQIRPGIFEGEGGRLYTEIPAPSAPPAPKGAQDDGLPA